MENQITVEQVCEFIATASQEDLECIKSALDIANQEERMRSNEEKMSEYRVGDRVKFTCTTRPEYLRGMTATITDIKRKRVVVNLDRPIGRFSRGIRTPVSLIEKI